MIYLLIGAIFVMVDFNITSAYPYIIGVIPDFIGYIFLLIGFLKIHRESVKFKKMVLPSVLMIVVSAAEYILNASGVIRALTGAPVVLFSIVGNVLALVIIFNIIEGFKTVESERGCGLKTNLMYKFYFPWAIFTAIDVVMTISSPDGVESMTSDIALIAQGLTVAAAIGFNVVLFLAIKKFNSLPAKEEPEPEPETADVKRSWKDQL